MRIPSNGFLGGRSQTRRATKREFTTRSGKVTSQHAVALEDGTTVWVPDGVDEVVGIDHYGDLIINTKMGTEDYWYLLTPCCYASGKGSDSRTGVVCRLCYHTVDEKFGDRVREGDVKSYVRK